MIVIKSKLSQCLHRQRFTRTSTTTKAFGEIGLCIVFMSDPHVCTWSIQSRYSSDKVLCSRFAGLLFDSVCAVEQPVPGQGKLKSNSEFLHLEIYFWSFFFMGCVSAISRGPRDCIAKQGCCIQIATTKKLLSKCIGDASTETGVSCHPRPHNLLHT